MKFHLNLSLLFLFAPLVLWCKPELPDTIRSYKLYREYRLADLDSVLKMDSLRSPEIFVLGHWDPFSFGGFVDIARPEGDSFGIYPLWIKASHVVLRVQDVNHVGAKEIIIQWFLDNAHSTWGNWHYEHEQGFIVLDPDSMKVLLNMETYNSEVAMWGDYSFDTLPDSTINTHVADGGSSFSCESYEFSFTETGFTILETADCPDQEDWEMNHYEVSDPVRYRYAFTKSGYVRVKE